MEEETLLFLWQEEELEDVVWETLELLLVDVVMMVAAEEASEGSTVAEGGGGDEELELFCLWAVEDDETDCFLPALEADEPDDEEEEDDVATARRGRSPPASKIHESVSWEIRWMMLMT